MERFIPKPPTKQLSFEGISWLGVRLLLLYTKQLPPWPHPLHLSYVCDPFIHPDPSLI